MDKKKSTNLVKSRETRESTIVPIQVRYIHFILQLAYMCSLKPDKYSFIEHEHAVYCSISNGVLIMYDDGVKRFISNSWYSEQDLQNL